MHQTKEERRKMAEIRQEQSTFVAPERPCQRCAEKEGTWCKNHEKHVPRKGTCDGWKRGK